MKFYARLNLYFHNAYARTIRLLILFFLIIYILDQFSRETYPRLSIFLLNLFLMNEVFFRYKISRILPGVTVAKNKGQKIYASFTISALSPFIREIHTQKIVSKLLKLPHIKYFMQKTNILDKEIILKDLPLNILASAAFDVAGTFHSKYVTTTDVFIAYLMLTEADTKLLFSKQIKSGDLSNLVYWLKIKFPAEESPPKKRWHFSGDGVSDFLVTGWTTETKKYTQDFTQLSIKNKAKIIGREKEFKTLLEGLIKSENNNVLLVGDTGSGKENLVRAFAYHSFEGNLISILNHRRVLKLMLGTFIAGAASRNELETRLQTIISEISHSLNVILYIPQFQDVMGTGSYALNISGALLQYLQSGEMPVIATVSTGDYKTYIEKNPIKEAFSIITLKEPDKDTAIQMALEKISEIENKNKVLISYRAVASSVELASKFLQDQALPGNAIALLQSVANKVALSNDPSFPHTGRKIVLEEHVIKHIEDTVHVAIAMPGKKEIEVLLHLEDKLHQRIIEQKEAITAISEAMRRVRSGMTTSTKPISFLFLGPTGVGKTETTKALADLYFGGEKNIIRLDMSEYTDEIGLQRLLGAPPGQSNERGELTDKIHDAPASLVLLDEFEKAHPKIHNLFLQVLDDGRLTDNKGVTVSFSNALIIATSNAGSEFIREEVAKGTAIDKKFHSRLLDHLQTNKIFKPELLNRFDDIITFKPLGESQVKQVIKLILAKTKDNLDKQDIKIEFDEAVIEKIAKEGFDQEFGARPLRRYIQDNIEDLIAQKKLKGEIIRGSKVNIGVDGASNLQVLVT
jgi:ATP-dependent Clp protease ATP-binding subunit ClpC